MQISQISRKLAQKTACLTFNRRVNKKFMSCSSGVALSGILRRCSRKVVFECRTNLFWHFVRGARDLSMKMSGRSSSARLWVAENYWLQAFSSFYLILTFLPSWTIGQRFLWGVQLERLKMTSNNIPYRGYFHVQQFFLTWRRFCASFFESHVV